MDRDTVRGRYDLERLLARLHSGEINLLVGTQMIAKGHDIHGITLVGVVGCDHALSMPDFRAAERVFQLMTQVSGRAGRGESAGARGGADVLSGPLRDCGRQQARLCELCGAGAEIPALDALSALRRAGQCAGAVPKLEEAAGWSAELGKWFQKAAPEGVRVLGPCTAPIARIKGIYRFHLILKSGSRKALNAALRGMLGARGRSRRATAQPGGGCGCAAADVSHAVGLTAFGTVSGREGVYGAIWKGSMWKKCMRELS